MPQSSSHAVQVRTPKVPRRRYQFRAFYATLLCMSLLAILSLVADQTTRYRHGAQYGAAQRRALEALDSNRLVKRDEECRLVHHAEDKCAFIKANCPDEEAGLFSYLSFYYCSLNKAQPVAFAILSLWLSLLFLTIGIAASDFFTINLSTIAYILGMSQSMAGVTFLAFGNGSPDVFSTFAAMSSHSGSLAIGELIGAAGFITSVVAGSMGIVREFKVGKKTFVRDVGFFIVSASFSMIFLADGRLQLWECCAMVGFYVFYVVFVVLWHWYLGQRRIRREREASARGHYLATANEEIEVSEEDHDEDIPTGQGRYRDEEDFGALERGSSPGPLGIESDDEEDEGRQLAAEMASSMRINRPRGVRRSTITPIRPSLVGALEFRSVLSSLQKTRGSHARPIHLRRYSDDPNSNLNQFDGPASESGRYSDHAGTDLLTTENDSNPNSRPTPTRTRAVSMNDAAAEVRANPAAFTVAHVPDIGIVAATPTFPRDLEAVASEHGPNTRLAGSPIPASPTFSVSPPPSLDGAHSSRQASRSSKKHRKRDTLAPPEEDYPGARHLRVQASDAEPQDGSIDSPPRRSRGTQRLSLQIPSLSRDSSHSRAHSPVVAFPPYTDSPLPLSSISSQAPSLVLPDATLTPDSVYTNPDLGYLKKPFSWWPYPYLPSPDTLVSVLFPVLYTWHDKTVWDRFVAVIMAPSYFLLAITLPVVDTDSKDKDKGQTDDDELDPIDLQRRRSTYLLTPESPSADVEHEWIRYRRATDAQSYASQSPEIRGHAFQDNNNNSASIAVGIEDAQHHPHSNALFTKQSSVDNHSIAIAGGPLAASEQDWNRWLVVVQIFMAPLFMVVIIWANTESGTVYTLTRMLLYSLLASLVAFAILILTTSPLEPPKYRFLLCFLGFVVSIAWISTIANEVVGVLKAFGVILGISDAILGLTIFAVGNSLGDLVADITVARLGYPVMALSACFGGPLLNILLGIGLSGIYMTITEANHKHAKHPGKAIRYKPYEIEVSGTLMVSAITLIVTLVGLLIAVPMNNWMMTKRIGWSLIGLWAVSTAINLAVEASGVWGNTTFW